MLRRFEVPSPALRQPLMRLVAIQSLMSAEPASLLGSLHPPWPSCFQATSVVSTQHRPPLPCEIGFILSLALPPLQSTTPLQTCPIAQALSSTFHGVSLLIATSTREVHHSASIPVSPLFRPQCFSHSRRLTPSRILRIYFTPLPRPGFSLQGFPPLPSRCASSTPRPLMSLTTLSYRRPKPTAPDPAASPSGC
jgi:hypothetical protein